MCLTSDSIHQAIEIGVFERLDKNGNRISYTVLDTPPLLNTIDNNNTLVHCTDGGFAYATWGAIDSIKNEIALIKFDHYGQLEWYKELVDSTFLPYQGAYGCTAMLQDNSSSFYITGWITHQNGVTVSTVVLKTDSFGNLIHRAILSDPNGTSNPFSIILNKRNNIVVGGSVLYYNNLNFSTSKLYTEIYELDTGLNLINHYLGVDTNGPAISSMIETQDGGYMLAGSYTTYRDVNENKWNGAIAKLDGCRTNCIMLHF